jgi:thiamine pyrophosphate-dependent acetolactate synthase large subunit-like protein
LGVALAQPQRRVFALEGDGSILMQLGSLATIAARRPRNLTIVVWDNGLYQITGSQPTATAAAADVVEIARGAGIAQSDWASDEEDFERLVERALNADGPWFIAARIDGKAPAGQTPREPVSIKDAFMRGIGSKAVL